MNFPSISSTFLNFHLFSFNFGFLLNYVFLLPPILTMMHLCIMLYTCWTPLLDCLYKRCDSLILIVVCSFMTALDAATDLKRKNANQSRSMIREGSYSDCFSDHFERLRTDKDQMRAAELIAVKPVVVLSGKGGCGKTEVVGRVFSCAQSVLAQERLVLECAKWCDAL